LQQERSPGVLLGRRFAQDTAADLCVLDLGGVVTLQHEDRAGVAGGYLEKGGRIEREAGEGADAETSKLSLDPPFGDFDRVE
jgi:hypothetical protein